MNPRRLYRCPHDRQLAGVAAGMGEPGSEPAVDSTASTGDPARATAEGGEPGTAWTAAGEPGAAWPAPNAAWATPDRRPDDRRGGGAGIVFGVLLVVFGAIAMANVLIPGWAVGGLWPAFVVAVGVFLLVGAVRRTADNR